VGTTDDFWMPCISLARFSRQKTISYNTMRLSLTAPVQPSLITWYFLSSINQDPYVMSCLWAGSCFVQHTFQAVSAIYRACKLCIGCCARAPPYLCCRRRLAKPCTSRQRQSGQTRASAAEIASSVETGATRRDHDPQLAFKGPGRPHTPGRTSGPPLNRPSLTFA
jgi:hypothetical protein